MHSAVTMVTSTARQLVEWYGICSLTLTWSAEVRRTCSVRDMHWANSVGIYFIVRGTPKQMK